MTSRIQHSKKGFTLIEMSIAVVISIIIALAAAPFFRTRAPLYEMENTAVEISGYLRAIRSEAISRNETLSLNYIQASHELEVYDGDDAIIKVFDVNAYDNSTIGFSSSTAYFNSQGQLLASRASMDYTTLVVSITDSRTSDDQEIRVTNNGRITVH